MSYRSLVVESRYRPVLASTMCTAAPAVPKYTREKQPAFRRELGAHPGHVFDAARGGIGESDVLEHIERRMVDAKHVGIGQRLVAAALHARANGANAVGQWGRASGPARRSRSATDNLGYNFTHRATSGIRAGKFNAAGCPVWPSLGKRYPHFGARADQ